MFNFTVDTICRATELVLSNSDEQVVSMICEKDPGILNRFATCLNDGSRLIGKGDLKGVSEEDILIHIVATLMDKGVL